MQDLLDNKYIFWIITGLWGGLMGLVLFLLKKQIEGQAKNMEQLRADCKQNAEKINDITANLPIQYTLRDEFLRVTTYQNQKLDKIGDAIGELAASVAAVRSAVTGGNKCGDQ